MKGEAKDQQHDFTLVLLGVTKLTGKLADALFAAGCDDATVSMRLGMAYLDFSRTAPTLQDAVLSAMRDVRKAGLDAVLVELHGGG